MIFWLFFEKKMIFFGKNKSYIRWAGPINLKDFSLTDKLNNQLVDIVCKLSVNCEKSSIFFLQPPHPLKKSLLKPRSRIKERKY
jgi:hypothetical protein